MKIDFFGSTLVRVMGLAVVGACLASAEAGQWRWAVKSGPGGTVVAGAYGQPLPSAGTETADLPSTFPHPTAADRAGLCRAVGCRPGLVIVDVLGFHGRPRPRLVELPRPPRDPPTIARPRQFLVASRGVAPV